MLKTSLKLKILIGLLVLAFINIVCVNALHYSTWPESDTINAYSYWETNTGCHKSHIQVTMDDLSGSNRLLCTINQLHEANYTLHYTLDQGYLYETDDTGLVYTENPQNDWIYVKLTETGGAQTSFEITIEVWEFTRK